METVALIPLIVLVVAALLIPIAVTIDARAERRVTADRRLMRRRR